jgi:hypothetical protein
LYPITHEFLPNFCVFVEFSTHLIIFLKLVAINAKFFYGIIATHAISLWGWLPPMLHPKNEKKRACHATALPFTLKNILMQNRNYENSNISPCKEYNLQKNHIKETKKFQDIKCYYFRRSYDVIFCGNYWNITERFKEGHSLFNL